MLPGKDSGPGTVPAQLADSASIMFIQNTTDCASTDWPSRNFQPFKLMVTVLLPPLHTGALANESE